MPRITILFLLALQGKWGLGGKKAQSSQGIGRRNPNKTRTANEESTALVFGTGSRLVLLAVSRQTQQK